MPIEGVCSSNPFFSFPDCEEGLRVSFAILNLDMSYVLTYQVVQKVLKSFSGWRYMLGAGSVWSAALMDDCFRQRRLTKG